MALQMQTQCLLCGTSRLLYAPLGSVSGPLSANFKILPVVVYGCETWSLTIMEECRLRVSENSVLRRIVGYRKDEVTGEWRKSLIICTAHPILFG